jgi:hypothetical protein
MERERREKHEQGCDATTQEQFQSLWLNCGLAEKRQLDSSAALLPWIISDFCKAWRHTTTR